MPAARTTAPKKSTAKAEASSVDITDLLAPPPLDPIDVTLLGETYTIRRDWTGAEVARFWALLNSGDAEKAADASDMMLGSREATQRYEAQLAPLPPTSAIVIHTKMFKIAGLVQRDGEPGESPAS